MNEKIKELAVKAQNNGDSIHYYDPVFVEKFANLIIKECEKINSGFLGHSTWLALHNLYSEHFGVEE